MNLEPNFVEFYQNEKRAICYELYTNEYKFEPDTVTVKVFKGNVKVDEKTALVFNNKMCVLIDTTVTKNTGEYIVEWKLEKNDPTLNDTEIFYKKTRLVIRKL